MSVQHHVVGHYIQECLWHAARGYHHEQGRVLVRVCVSSSSGAQLHPLTRARPWWFCTWCSRCTECTEEHLGRTTTHGMARTLLVRGIWHGVETQW